MMHLVDAVCDKLERADAGRPMPAYCDPANEVRGAKFDATKGLTQVEIAARIRQDIKDALKSGLLPKGVKVSVRCKSYSGGGSIDINITAVPPGFRVCNPKYVAWRKENPQDSFPPFRACDMRSDEYSAVLETLKGIHDAYNRDNSDSMSDYFDVRYYGDVTMHWELHDRLKAAELEA